MLSITSQFPSNTHIKWALIGLGVLAGGAILFMQQIQLSQLSNQLAASQDEVLELQDSKQKANEASENKNKPANEDMGGSSNNTVVSGGGAVPTAPAEISKQEDANTSHTTTHAQNQSKDCKCPDNSGGGTASASSQQNTASTGQNSQETQKSSGGLVTGLLGGAGGLLNLLL